MPSPWSRISMTNFGLRVAAVLLALALFIHVKTEAREDHEVQVPIRWKGLPATLVFKNPVPQFVQVKVRANGKQLLRLQFNRPELVVDLKDVVAGTTFTRLLTPADIVMPRGVEAEIVEVVEPRTLALEVDEQVTREVRILPVVTSTPARGHTVRGQPEAAPDHARVTGPRTVLEKLDFVRTRPIDLGALDKAAEFETDLENPGPGIRLSPAKVRVRVAVEPLAQKTFPDVPVQVLHSSIVTEAHADPATVAVTVLGPDGLLKLLSTADLEARIDARNLLTGKHVLLVEVDLPESDVSLVSTSPDHCTVTLQ